MDVRRRISDKKYHNYFFLEQKFISIEYFEQKILMNFENETCHSIAPKTKKTNKIFKLNIPPFEQKIVMNFRYFKQNIVMNFE